MAASIIRIKRSGTAGTPSTLANGELAYSYLDGAGGDRLYIGTGAGSGGNAADIVAIGGKYFTDLLDHPLGTLTANSAILVDDDKKINELLVGDLKLTNSTFSSTSTNGGSIIIRPAGTGVVTIDATSALVVPAGTTAQRTAETESQGAIRYNTSISQFEGYDGANWSSLGGVRSVDGETRIVAEEGAIGDKTLYFTTADTLRVTIDETDFTILNSLNVQIESTTDSTSTASGALTVAGGVGIAKDVFVGGDLTANSVQAGDVLVSSNSISATEEDDDLILAANGTGNVSVSGFRVINVGTPTAPTDAVNKSYVDDVAQGITARPAVRAATKSNLVATYNNGTAGVGATLTADDVGSFPSLGGVNDWVIGDGVLVKDQTNAWENGRYVITTLGDAENEWVLTRCTKCDDKNEIPSSYVFVQEGDAHKNTGWVATVNNLQTFEVGATDGTGDIIWVQFTGSGAFTAGAGLDLTGSVFSVDLATNSGLSFDTTGDGGKLRVDSTIAGTGLVFNDGVINAQGTADRITVDSTSIDIASTYVGQTSITTVGTIATGTWQGDTVAVAYGGTGLDTLTPKAVFITDGTGASFQFITGTQGDLIQFDSEGVPIASNVLDGGTYE